MVTWKINDNVIPTWKQCKILMTHLIIALTQDDVDDDDDDDDDSKCISEFLQGVSRGPILVPTQDC